jgi:membrane protein implicated in regulation of membrane protease activity
MINYMDKAILGGFLMLSFIIYMLYLIKKDGNLPSFIIYWIFLIIAFVLFEVDHGWLYILGFFSALTILSILWYKQTMKKHNEKNNKLQDA